MARVLTESEAADFLGVSRSFLRQSRRAGGGCVRAEGPPWVRLGGGRNIRYLQSDLEAWLERHRVVPEDVANRTCAATA